jgi:linoleoyl-CoA desaturase
MEQAKINFKEDCSTFFSDLVEATKNLLDAKSLKRGIRIIQLKFVLYSILLILGFVSLYTHLFGNHFISLLASYLLIGISGLLLAFNSGHDAAHETFSRKTWVNAAVFYFTFNVQGVNSRLWKMRHIHSHHPFPNVDGCDVDIDENPLMRLSPSHPFKKHHKYQYLYASFFYLFYTLHWILVKDFKYLRKNELANLNDISHSPWMKLELISLKVAYFTLILGLPLMFAGWTWWYVLLCFGIMHHIISLFFILTLAISHLSDATIFVSLDATKAIDMTYFQHQLAVSVDYHPRSIWGNWIFGGFNAHAAHHLFPNVPHSLYPKMTPYIQKAASNFNYTYNELNLLKAVKAHYNYLRLLGEG